MRPRPRWRMPRGQSGEVTFEHFFISVDFTGTIRSGCLLRLETGIKFANHPKAPDRGRNRVNAKQNHAESPADDFAIRDLSAVDASCRTRTRSNCCQSSTGWSTGRVGARKGAFSSRGSRLGRFRHNFDVSTTNRAGNLSGCPTSLKLPTMHRMCIERLPFH
jgi:hypothetical protein